MPCKSDEGAPARKDFLSGLDANPFWDLEPDPTVKTDKIVNLCRYLDRQKVEDLLAKFEAEARERIAAILSAPLDRDSVRQQTHSLAGLAGSVGCVELERVSRTIYAEAGRLPGTAGELIKRLDEALPLLKAALDAVPD